MTSVNSKNLEIIGNNASKDVDDETSLNSMSSIDLHSTKAAHYESIHLPHRTAPSSPLNMVISRAPSSAAESCDWPDVSLDSSSIAPIDGELNVAILEIRGKTPQVGSTQTGGVFQNRKGRPLANRGILLQTLPETIKIRGRENTAIPDGELMYVSKFNLAPKKSLISTITPGVLSQVFIRNHILYNLL